MATTTQTRGQYHEEVVGQSFETKEKTEEAAPAPRHEHPSSKEDISVEPSMSKLVAEDESRYPTGAKFYLIMFSVGLVLILGALDSSIVAVAVPAITNHFHSIRDVGWYAAAYRLTLCSFQFMFGKLYKFYSLKIVFLCSVLVFMVGGVICAGATSSEMFILGRAVSGFASAGIIAGCFSSLVQALPLRKRPLWSSILATIEGAAEMGSPLIGGLIVARLNWRWCFWINLPLGTVALIVLTFCLSHNEPSEMLSWQQKIEQLDLLSNAVFVPGITCLFLALGWAGTRNAWDSPTIIVLLAAFSSSLIGFAYLQYQRQDAAALPPRLFINRSVISGFVFSLCCNSCVQVVQYYLPTYFQTIRGYSAAKSGVMMLPVVFSFLTAMFCQGCGVSLIGYYVPFMLLGSVLMPVFAGLMTTLTPDSSLAKLICYSGLTGFAAGIGFQSPQTAVQCSLPDDDASLGLAIIIFAQHFGPAVFISAAQSIFISRLQNNLREVRPSMDVISVEGMSFTDLKQSLSGSQLRNVLGAFDHSLAQTWYLSVALGCITMIGSLAMEWKTIRPKDSRTQ